MSESEPQAYPPGMPNVTDEASPSSLWLPAIGLLLALLIAGVYGIRSAASNAASTDADAAAEGSDEKVEANNE